MPKVADETADTPACVPGSRSVRALYGCTDGVFSPALDNPLCNPNSCSVESVADLGALDGGHPVRRDRLARAPRWSVFTKPPTDPREGRFGAPAGARLPSTR